MTAPAVSYRQRPESSPEVEASALANVYAFILNRRAKKDVAEPRQADDVTDEKEGRRNASLASTDSTR